MPLICFEGTFDLFAYFELNCLLMIVEWLGLGVTLQTT